jgi:hypothetical protein
LGQSCRRITRLPKAEQQWQTAAEVLMLIGERGGSRYG